MSGPAEPRRREREETLVTRHHMCFLQPVFPAAELPVPPVPARQRRGSAPLRPPRLHWWGLVGDLLRWWSLPLAWGCCGEVGGSCESQREVGSGQD